MADRLTREDAVRIVREIWAASNATLHLAFQKGAMEDGEWRTTLLTLHAAVGKLAALYPETLREK